MTKEIEMHFGEPYKYFGEVLYHLSKTFTDKGAAFAYAKEKRIVNNPKIKILVKIETVRYHGIKPIYHVYVRQWATKISRGKK